MGFQVVASIKICEEKLWKMSIVDKIEVTRKNKNNMETIHIECFLACLADVGSYATDTTTILIRQSRILFKASKWIV